MHLKIPFAAPKFLIVILALIYGGISLDLFSTPNHLIQDVLIGLDLSSVPEQPVLWVRVVPNDFDSHLDWSRIIDRIRNAGAALILFSYLPRGSDWRLVEGDRLLAGRRGTLCEDQPVLVCLEPGPPGIPATVLPPAHGDRHRFQYAYILTADGESTALEIWAARRLGQAPLIGTADRYRVDFAGSLPTIELARIAEEGVSRELVKDKVVLIGPGLDGPGLWVPGGPTPLAWSEYQGYALRTLLRKSQRTEMQWPMRSALVVVCAATALLIFQVSWTYSPLAALILVFSFTLVGSWLAIHLQLVLAPTTELLTTEALAAWIIGRHRRHIQDQHLQRLAVETMARLEAAWNPTTAPNSDEQWAQIVRMIMPALDLQRCMFLERIPNDHRVREIKAVNCSLEEVAERRRDYNRFPYTEAIRTRLPLRLSRPFLDPVETPERQYLAALVFGGEILGFWAFTLMEGAVKDEGRLLLQVREFADQIADLLYRWTSRAADARSSSRLWRRLLYLESGNTLEQVMEQGAELFHRRYRLLREALDHQKNGVMLYDLFGRVQHCNERMRAILDGLDFPPFDNTLADLIALLSSEPLGLARDYVRYLVLEQGPLTLRVAADKGMAAGLLALRPLRAKETADLGEDQPFRLFGILVELIDVSAMKSIIDFKDRLMEQVSYQFRNDLESVLIALPMLEDPRLSERHRGRVLSIMRAKVAEVVETSRRIEGVLGQDLHRSGMVECYPVTLDAVLKKALEDVEEAARKRRIAFDDRGSGYHRLTLAAPDPLQQALTSMLKVLVDDAIEGSKISIEAESGAERLNLRLSNDGFGLPAPRLQEFIFGSEKQSSEEFKALRTAAHIIPQWGGELRVDGDVGRGISFELSLLTFL